MHQKLRLQREDGEDCGQYDVADVEGDSGYEGVILTQVLYEHCVDSSLEAFSFNIFHSAETNPQKGEQDWWRIVYTWQVGTMDIENPDDPESPFIIPHLHILEGHTSADPVWEGVYNGISDTWTVTFDNAEFSLMENSVDPEGLLDLWMGKLSFAVEIQRCLPLLEIFQLTS